MEQAMIVGGLAVASYLAWSNSRKLKINVSGPPMHQFPLNSTAWSFLKRTKDLNIFLEELSDKYGPTFHVNIFGKSMIMINDPTLSKKILGDREHFNMDPDLRSSIIYFGGVSMFSSEGWVWKKRHEVLQPLHKTRFLKYHTKTISEIMGKVVNLVEELKISKPDQPIDLYIILQRATIDVIGSALFGQDLGVLSENPEDYLKSPKISENFKINLAALNNRLFLPRFLWPFYYYLTGERKANKEMKAFLKGLIAKYEEKKKELEEQGKLKDDHDDDSEGEEENYENEFRTTTALHLIMEFRRKNPEIAEQIYPENGIVAELFSIFGAGHDTTTTTSCFLLTHLAQHQDVQDLLYEEIQEVLKNNTTGIITEADLNNMKYLGWVIKESMRLQPSVTSLPRNVVQDTTFEGINFPKNSQVLLVSSHIHKSSRYYQNPFKFDPSRWDPSKGQKESPLFPFGYGVRACFGQKLAVLEMKIFVVKLLQKFRVAIDPQRPPEVEFAFGVVPKNSSFFVLLNPRN